LTLAATHVVPLVEVHRAGDRGEALIAVMVVRVQGGGYAKMTSGRRGRKLEQVRRQPGQEPRAPRRSEVNSAQFAPGETERGEIREQRAAVSKDLTWHPEPSSHHGLDHGRYSLSIFL